MSDLKVKSQLPTILATSFLTALFLFLLLAGGAFWWFRSIEMINVLPAESHKDSQTKPTPRVKNPSLISASEITKIQFSESKQSTQTAPVQYFGNVNTNNYLSTSEVVSFSSDGTAVKISTRISTINGVRSPETIEKYSGSITREKFLELAQIFVENDFLGEEDSKTSTSLPINYTLNIIYSGGEKKFKTSNSGDDTPEADAMLKAFKSLARSVNWQKL